jgi:proline iminopeptidase
MHVKFNTLRPELAWLNERGFEMKRTWYVCTVLALVTVLALIPLTGMVSDQQSSQPPTPSAEHQKLQLWFGEWTYEVEYQTTFLGPGGRSTGKMSGRSIMDGVGGEYMSIENGTSGEIRTLEIDTYDPAAKNYPCICVSSDGGSWQGSYTIKRSVATWEGTGIGSGRRYMDRGTDTVAPDGMSFIKKAEISKDDNTWLPWSVKKGTKVKAKPIEEKTAAGTYPMQEGFVDANGALIYYKTIGRGTPLVILHGGPGATHDYFLPYLLPLCRQHQLIFIDERGSGKSEKLEDASAYTVENMVEDIEALREALKLGRIALLGHSCGGVLAQAYGLKYQQNLTHLILCSTFHSTIKMNEVFHRIKENMPLELRQRIDGMEKVGLFGHGKEYEKRRYTPEYMIAAWGEGYFPYLYQNRPDPSYDPLTSGFAWDVYYEMWGRRGEFMIDGNLKSVEYGNRLSSIKVPTLITVGDHDECAPWLSEEMHKAIPGSKLVVLPKSGHMTFVDQPDMFIRAVNDFLQR